MSGLVHLGFGVQAVGNYLGPEAVLLHRPHCTFGGEGETLPLEVSSVL